MAQLNLTDFEADDADEPDETDTDAAAPAPETEPADGLRCPWCGAPEGEFHEPEPLVGGETGGLSCGACNAVLPTDAEWFQNGEHIA